MVLNSSRASFYQAGTMASYCKHYLKFIELENEADKHEAGICAGYVASSLEIMDLSGQLCHKDQVNLTNVANLFVNKVNSDEISLLPASFVMVELLQNNYACEGK